MNEPSVLSNLYTIDEYDYIYKHYNEEGAEAVGEALNRSASSVESKAQKLGLVPHNSFTDEELSLAKEYNKTLGTALIFLFPYRTVSEIEELIKCVT